MDYQKIIDDHVKTLANCRTDIVDFCQKVVDICIKTHQKNKHLYICGNGGSAADATHIVGELVGRLREDRPPFRATCLGADFATMTAVSNDYGYECIFAREVMAKVLPGDTLWCLSTSGNSKNIINAINTAKEIENVTIVGMSGLGGELRQLADVCLCVPNSYSDRIQELHQLAYHLICQGIEHYLLEK